MKITIEVDDISQLNELLRRRSDAMNPTTPASQEAWSMVDRPRATPLKVYVVITGQKLFCIKKDFDKAVQLSGYGGWVFQHKSQQWESLDSKTVVIRAYEVE